MSSAGWFSIAVAIAGGVGVLTLAYVATAKAQPLDCNDPQTQAAMDACAGQDWQRADRDLNRIYGQVRAALRKQDHELGPDFKSAETSLVEGQRGWIAYRDGHCDVEASSARGGSMERGLFSSCAATLTMRRTDELRAILKTTTR
ncbi:MAG: lysozyme inhibitor LprI family protein [Pseudomonadota bacterium]